MALIDSEILAALAGLSLPTAGGICGLGLLLWITGRRWHQFWVVIGLTITAGMIGLHTGRDTGGHLLVVAFLMAISAGIMAMELARLSAFAAGGIAFWLLVKAILPAANDLWICFLLGGIISVLLYSFWTMLLTAFLGSGLMLYGGLTYWGTKTGFPAATWAEQRADMLHLILAGTTLLGVIVQGFLERRVARRAEKKKSKKKLTLPKQRPNAEPLSPAPTVVPPASLPEASKDESSAGASGLLRLFTAKETPT